MNIRHLVPILVALICLSCEKEDGFAASPPNESGGKRGQAEAPKDASPEDAARQCVVSDIRTTLDQFKVDGDAKLYAEEGQYFYRFTYEPENVALNLIPLDVSDRERENGILGRFLADVTTGVTVAGKYFERTSPSGSNPGSSDYLIPDDQFPYLSPWSPELKFADAFSPYLVEVVDGGEPVFRSPLENFKSLAPNDIVKLLNRDQTPMLSDSARLALTSVNYAFRAAHAATDDSVFVFETFSLRGRLPSAQTAYFAPSASAALTWKDNSAQNTLIRIREIVGPRQFWVVEEAASQVDKINGRQSRGKVYVAAVGFEREAELYVQTEYLHPEQMSLGLLTPWSEWRPPGAVFYTALFQIRRSDSCLSLR